MAFRDDITVYWHLDPRIIEVAAPSTDLVIQDLYDTCKTLEQRPQNLVHPKLCDAFGKIDLGGGKFTVVTLVLLDALVKFEDRAGPSTTECNVRDGNLVSYDTVGEVFVTPMEPSTYTFPIIRQATTGAAVGVNIGSLVADMWNALRSAYNQAGSMGEAIGLIPTMNTVVGTIDSKIDTQDAQLDAIEGKIDVIDGNVDTVTTQTLPKYQTNQGWVENIDNSLITLDCSIHKDHQLYTPTPGSTMDLELYVNGSLEYTTTGLVMGSEGFFQANIPWTSFNPAYGTNFISVTTVTEGVGGAQYKSAVVVSRAAFTEAEA